MRGRKKYILISSLKMSLKQKSKEINPVSFVKMKYRKRKPIRY